MLITITSVIVFTAVILLLVLTLIFAESKLLPQGAVKILINKTDDKSPSVNPGNTLLNALSNEGIFIASACGGGGTCAQCKCQVQLFGCRC